MQDQPHSLVPVRQIQWQDKVKTAGGVPGCRGCRKVTRKPFNRLRGSTPDLLSGFTPLAFFSPEMSTRQWSYLTHT